MADLLSPIQYNLDMAKPAFIRMMKDLNPKAGRWVQYQGVEFRHSAVIFKFKSSQNSLSFEVQGGHWYGEFEPHVPYDMVYEYFKALKQPYIEY